MTPGNQTTEHRRAIRAEIACTVIAGLGMVLCARGGAYLLAAGLLALAMTSYAAIALLYGHQRSRLKATEAEATAAARVAELQRPTQRVV